MKILIVTTEYPPFPIAGSGMYAVNLVKGLKDHSVTVLTPSIKNAAQNEADGSVEIRRINTLSSIFSSSGQNFSMIDRRILFGLALRKYLKKNTNVENYDVVHFLSLIEASFVDFKTLNETVKTVVSVNDYYALNSTWNIFKFPYKSSDIILRYFHHNIIKYFNRSAIRKANRIIANSNYVANSIQALEKINSAKLKVVYRGVDTGKFNKEPDNENYTNNNILFIGANMERKGGLYLIKALPLILKRFPKAKLNIIGSTSKTYLNKIKAVIGSRGLKDKVNIVKYTRAEEMPLHYSKANVFVMPSIIEGLGQVFLEAMMCKIPVVGTNVGGIPEIITNETGRLVEPRNHAAIADAVMEIFSNPKMAEELGENGRKRVLKHFTRETMIDETIKVYEGLIQ